MQKTFQMLTMLINLRTCSLTESVSDSLILFTAKSATKQIELHKGYVP